MQSESFSITPNSSDKLLNGEEEPTAIEHDLGGLDKLLGIQLLAQPLMQPFEGFWLKVSVKE